VRPAFSFFFWGGPTILAPPPPLYPKVLTPLAKRNNLPSRLSLIGRERIRAEIRDHVRVVSPKMGKIGAITISIWENC
jgi:hypothetical protein